MKPFTKIQTPFFTFCFAFSLIAGLTSSAFAQRDLTDIPDPDPELQRQKLGVHEDFNIELFAADPQLSNPTQMNFDTRGRLWVATSETYPQIKPGGVANDKILVLEDTNEDGRIDKTTVFADGLLIPTAVAPTPDGKGAYIANSTDLVYLEDTDGDGKADKREIVFSGFGTEDTHHILHTFRWGHDGYLYMNQSIYIHSHIETPHGVKRLNGSGIWRFKPETMELEVVARGMVNPWGHHFDDWGQAFATDGAGSDGINYIFDGVAYLTAVGVPRILKGMNPGSPKYCGMEVIGGTHIPEEWRGNILTNDFRGHRVCRFVLNQNKSNFSSQEKAELIKSSHVAFRPIDIKMGPDGAIYIADWYNPIIQHGEVDFRDERRDHVHGRIWRVTNKNKPVLKRERLTELSYQELISKLASPEPWIRHQTKRLLADKGNKLSPLLLEWVQAQQPTDKLYEHNLLEALWVFQTWRTPKTDLLHRLLNSKDHKARAAAVHVLIDWRNDIPDASQQLAKAALDEHPRVRLEAVRGLAKIPSAESMLAALKVLDLPMDTFLDYALWVTARDLQAEWVPAVEAGDERFVQDTNKLLFLMNALGGEGGLNSILRLVHEQKIPAKQLPTVYELFLQRNNPDALGVVFTEALHEKYTVDQRADWLNKLTIAASERKVLPKGNLERITSLLNNEHEALQLAAIRCVGVWKRQSLEAQLTAKLNGEGVSSALATAILNSLAQFSSESSVKLLRTIANSGTTDSTALAATAALLRKNDPSAPQIAAKHLSKLKETTAVSLLLGPAIANKGLSDRIAKELTGKSIQRDVAVVALRAIQTSGRKFPELSAAITKAGNIKLGPRKLSAKEMQRMVELIKTKGNAARGESIYRRKELACLQCHAIAGAGGRVGPDILSLGGSAQVDYLVDSLLAPNDKVKENYHTTVVVTEEGKTFSGLKVRETDTDIILRDANDKEFSVPLSQVDEEIQGASMMPSGLTESLTESEFVDLVRFLSELGRTAEFTVSKEPVARSWQTLNATNEALHRLRRTRAGNVTQDDDSLVWSPIYSTVSGDLPIDSVPVLRIRNGQEYKYVRTQLIVTQATDLQLALNQVEGLEVWLDEEPLSLGTKIPLKLAEGTYRVTVGIRHRERKTPIRLELQLPTDTSTAAKWYVGK